MSAQITAPRRTDLVQGGRPVLGMPGPKLTTTYSCLIYRAGADAPWKASVTLPGLDSEGFVEAEVLEADAECWPEPWSGWLLEIAAKLDALNGDLEATTDPRDCCWACEVDGGCRDLHCSCHDHLNCTHAAGAACDDDQTITPELATA